MKATKTVEETRCDRCGASKCIHVHLSVAALWYAAGEPAAGQDAVVPDLCKRCVERIVALAQQIRTQRRRAWSEKAAT